MGSANEGKAFLYFVLQENASKKPNELNRYYVIENVI